MWPTCIDNLTPAKYELKTEIPKFLRTAFNRKGVLREEDMFVPIHLVRNLGACSTDKYIDCPNMPEHHVENADSLGDQFEYFSSTGKYYWFDFDIEDKEKVILQLRMVFNEGSADCNDGFWGAVWDRNTAEIIANIMSTGDSESTIEVISPSYLDILEAQQNWILTDFEDDQDPLLCDLLEYANDQNLEKLIGLAIRICCVYTYEEVYQMCGYDL
jgi:hypothetical protein